jgi:LuxR family maltose regulon positive regulatory protein
MFQYLQYFTPRLRNSVQKISTCPVSIVAAPAGSGKTSLVRQAANRSGLRTLWVNVADINPQNSYAKFCEAFDIVNTSDMEKLSGLGFPSGKNSSIIASRIMTANEGGEDCILVVDGFQYLQSVLPVNVLSALLHHQKKWLHLVILTSHIWDGLLFDASSIMLIEAKDFSLMPDEIRAFFAEEGVIISGDEAERIFHVTNGWSAAVFLHLHQFSRFGRSINENNTMVLVEELIWNRMNKDMKEYMLKLAPFDSFDRKAVCHVLKCETLPVDFIETLRSTPLITFDAVNHLYKPHKIMLGFFRTVLDQRPPEYKTETYNCAGEYLMSIHKMKEALYCFAGAANYQRILGVDHVALYPETAGDEAYYKLILQVLKEVPASVRNSYPATMLCFARVLFEMKELNLCRQLLREVQENAELLADNHLLGEAVLMSHLEDFPDICKMRQKYECAAELLNGVSRIILPDSPYMSGSLSILDLFYTVPGNADQIAAELEEAIHLYSTLTDGHGSGADLLYRGELALLRAQFEDALIFSYKAEQRAAQNGQYTIVAGALMLRGNAAIGLQDEALLEETMRSLENSLTNPPLKHGKEQFFHMISSALQLQYYASGRPEQAAAVCPEFRAPHPADRLLFYTRIVGWMFTARYAKVIGIMEHEKERNDGWGLLSLLFDKLIRAAAYAALGKKRISEKLLAEAGDIAKPDHLSGILQLGDAICKILWNGVAEDSHSPSREKTEKGEVLRSPVQDLTTREREVARLAAQGMRNREIAKKLYISEGTVRNHLSIIYQKLNIDRRGKLSVFARELSDTEGDIV